MIVCSGNCSEKINCNYLDPKCKNKILDNQEELGICWISAYKSVMLSLDGGVYDDTMYCGPV